MDSIAKRLTAALTATLFALWSVLFPVSVHAATYNAASNLTGKQWYVPAQSTGVAGNAVVATAATMLGRANPWVAAITLGTPIMQYLLERRGGGKVVVAPRNAVQPINGSGWSNGVPAGSVPPAVVVTADWTSGTFPDASSACNAACSNQRAAVSPAGSACQSIISTSQGCFGSTLRQPSGETVAGWSSTVGCPVGYALDGNSNCVLTDPWTAKWPSDGVGTWTPKQDGTGLEPHPQDPDPVYNAPSAQEIQNPAYNYSPDEFGNPHSTTIQPQSGGGFKLDQRVQTTTNNQTTTTINNITVNNAGNVINISTTTVPGTIDQASPTAAPVSSGGGVSVNFPTDYNRESTQQSIQQKLEDIKQGTGAADQPNYSTDTDAKKQAMNDEIKQKTDAIPGEFAGDKSNWFSWVWTPPVGQCSPWTNTIHGQTVTWDVCPYVAKIRDVIGFLMAVGGAWIVYNQMFRREES